MISRDNIKSFIEEVFEAGEFDGCHYKFIDGDYAIVFSWNTETTGEPILYGKLAYNCDDLQCDYDCDWYMPEVFGEVQDTEIIGCTEIPVDELCDFFIEQLSILEKVNVAGMKYTVGQLRKLSQRGRKVKKSK